MKNNFLKLILMYRNYLNLVWGMESSNFYKTFHCKTFELDPFLFRPTKVGR